MVSVYTVLYVLLLFSELSSHLVTEAMPAYKVEDGVNEQDGLGLMAGDEPMTEPAVVPAAVPPVYRRNHVTDNNARDEDGSPKIYILSVSVSSPSLKTSASLSMFKKLLLTQNFLKSRGFVRESGEFLLEQQRRSPILVTIYCICKIWHIYCQWDVVLFILSVKSELKCWLPASWFKKLS